MRVRLCVAKELCDGTWTQVLDVDGESHTLGGAIVHALHQSPNVVSAAYTAEETPPHLQVVVVTKGHPEAVFVSALERVEDFARVLSGAWKEGVAT